MRAVVSASLSVSVSLITFAFALLVPSIAHADNASSPSADPQPIAGGANPNSTTPALDSPADGSVPKRPEPDGRFHAVVDFVFGFGATNVVSQRIVGPLITDESRTAGRERFTTTSFNLGAAFDINRNIQVGVLVPLGAGSLYGSDDTTRGSAVIGNVTVGGNYTLDIRKDLKLKAGLGVALPTATGDALPDSNGLANHLDQTALDRYSLLHAMQDSRGREDTASFSSDHLGLVPKVGVFYIPTDKLEVEGYAKYQSLHATADRASYEGSIVVAGRATYHITKVIDGTLRLWTNIPVAGPDSAILAAEPQFSARLGWVTPIVGVVLPIAGELTNPYDLGVRLALAARF